MLVRSRPKASRCCGYSLIELVITVALTSLVIVVFFTLFSTIQIKSVDPIFQVKAAELGQAYLEEIGLKKFDHFSPAGNGVRCNELGPTCSSTLGPEGGESRTNFNDIDDYHNLSDAPPVDALGNTRTGFTGFQVSVNVIYAGTDLGLTAQSMKKVEVVVIAPDQTRYVFSQYRGNF